MLRNYLTVAVRNLLRHKGYSAINVAGLAVGMAFCILTFLFVRNEWTYDTFHENAGRIYRVYKVSKGRKGETRRSVESRTPLAPALAENFPEIKRTVRIMRHGGPVNYEGKVFHENWLFVDLAFFEMFSFPLRQGDPRTALRDKSGIVISEDMARKYFGDEDPMGKRMSLKSIDPFQAEGGIYSFVVTGVARPVPSNSTIRFDFLIPYENVNMVGLDPNSWDRSTSANSTYVQLWDHAQASDLEAKLPLFVQSVQRLKQDSLQLRLQPLTDIHLNTGIWGPGPVGDPKYSYILSGISLLVLFIACVNFVNLSVGRSATRAREVARRTKEIGIRKVLGASVASIVTLLSKEFVILVGVANLIAWPVAYYAMSRWLQDFAYRIELGIGVFVLGGILALVIALLTVSAQAIRAARANPVEALRYE